MSDTDKKPEHKIPKIPGLLPLTPKEWDDTMEALKSIGPGEIGDEEVKEILKGWEDPLAR